MPGQFQFITYRLADSLPRALLTDVHSASVAGSDEFHECLDGHLDQGYGSCRLKIPEIAELVQNAFLHFDGERYNLLHWVVMPNHVHTMIRVMPGFALGKLIHSWKSFTAHEAHKVLGTSGDFWQPDFFDRSIRNEDHYYLTARYIEENPVKAGLVALPEQWPYGSAYLRVNKADECEQARVTRALRDE